MDKIQKIFINIKREAKEALAMVERSRKKPQNTQGERYQYDQQIIWINCVVEDCDKVLVAGDGVEVRSL